MIQRFALLGAGALMMGLAACGDTGPVNNTTTSGGTGATGGGCCKVVTGQTAATTVNMTDAQKFEAATVSVKVNDVVKWHNNGATLPHNVTFADPNSSVAHDTVAPGADEEIQFTVAGKYDYVCTFHPGMTGTVTVG
jgi:plastocyanin